MEGGCQEGALKKQGREAEEEKEEKGQRNIRHEIAQTVVASIKEKAGPKVKQGWDWSQIGNEKKR